jgi:hypothetical protein
MERVAPRQVAYENQLPLAIESKSQRRKFYPEGATIYGPNGNGNGNPNIIRIPINADSLLDTQHSYLQFTIRNLDGGGRTMGLDVGLPHIKRVRLESAGTTLEDIDNYGKLFGAVLFPAQASAGAVNEYSTAGMGVAQLGSALTDLAAGAGGAGAGQIADSAFNSAAGGNANTDAEIIAEVDRLRDGIIAAFNTRTASSGIGSGHDGAATIDNGGSKTFSVCLHTGLLNIDKYLPLVMMNAGLVLELELDVANSIGVNSADLPLNWEMKDVVYIAHLIDLQRDFYDRLRMVMEGSGGVLQLTGTTFRSYQSNFAAGVATPYNVNIPARMKSIKSIFFTNTYQTQRHGTQRYGIGGAVPNGVKEYQFRVGSVVYPAQSVKVSASNKGEAYQELRKAFGSLGSLTHGGVLLNNTSYYPAANTEHALASGSLVATPFGLDFESFPKTTLENGINSADRSLPITLDIVREGAANISVDVDVFVMCDAVWYVNLDGSVSVSI